MTASLGSVTRPTMVPVMLWAAAGGGMMPRAQARSRIVDEMRMIVLVPSLPTRKWSLASAPQGRRIVAQGDQPWVKEPITRQAPQGRRKHIIYFRNLFPNVPFIKFNSLFPQKRQQFLLKRHPLMVFFLPRDVLGYCINMRMADAERPCGNPSCKTDYAKKARPWSREAAAGI